MTRTYFYRNLRTQTWSARQAGIVIDHPEVAYLSQVEFRVNRKGRDRVRREQQKNVHAFVIGDWETVLAEDHMPRNGEWRQAHYDPYECDSFVDKETRQPIKFAEFVKLDDRSRVWYHTPVVSLA